MPRHISHSSYKNSREELWPSRDAYPRPLNWGSQHGGAVSEHGSSPNSHMSGQEGKCRADNFRETCYFLFWCLSFRTCVTLVWICLISHQTVSFLKTEIRPFYIFLCPRVLVFVLYLLNSKWCVEVKLKANRVCIIIGRDLFVISSSQSTQVCK